MSSENPSPLAKSASAPARLGHSRLAVARLGFGGGTLGDPNEVIGEERAQATLAAAYDLGIRHFDTAPWYGLTKSERRIGAFLRAKPRDSYTLSTKVGRVFFPPDDPASFRQTRWAGGLPFDLRFDYTRSGFERSHEDSLARLGVASVDALVVHDLDFKFHKTEEGVAARLRELDEGGGFEWLLEQKRSGRIEAIGVGVNEAVMIPRFLERFDGIDFLLVAMPYTLLDQPALDGAFEQCAARGISVVIGAVFASGILATGPREGSIYAYGPASPETLERARRIEAVCSRHGVPLGAAALQFPLAHPVVASVIPGANSPEIVRSNLRWISHPIPPALWDELKAEKLLRPDAPTP